MTFSILARDPSNGRFGVAVATCHLAVGSTVPHIRSGVGAVATQAHTNPHLGICGLERMEQNRDAEAVLASLLRDDPQIEHRQLHLIDACGRTAGWTGRACGPYASHRCHSDLAVAGNLLTGEAVLLAMEEAFLLSDPSWKLGRRLLTALRAGEEAGGDLRSTHATSAALQVSGEAAFPLLDLRVDFEERAVDSLTALYERSQQLWVQQWRDSFAELPNPASKALNRTVAPLFGEDSSVA